MYAQKLFNPAISAKTIRHAHPTLRGLLTMPENQKGSSLLLRECTD